MTPYRVARRAGLAVTVLAVCLVAGNPDRGLSGDDPPKAPAATAWDLDEVLRQLAFHPNDPYLQYVALQLGKRDGRENQVVEALDRRNGGGGFLGGDRGRRSRADLFSTFTGALAVQESLQLDTMRGERPGGNRAVAPAIAPPVPKDPPIPPPPPLPPKDGVQPPPRDRKPDAPQNKPPAAVAVSKLTGPTVKSHPWEKMLGDKKPDVGVLANCVPDDFYFVEFRSIAKVNEVSGMGELWGGHIFTQALGGARSQATVERIKKQLGLFQLPPRVIEALEIDAVGVTGSDLFLTEGSDVTVLVQSKRIATLLQLLDRVLKLRGTEEKGTHVGVEYTHRFTPDGTLNAFAANPRPDLHVRSNSLAGLKRVLETVVGKTADGQPAGRLGETREFQYIRTLMPRGAEQEDGLIYLSDAFIRRMVGPELKLTERRRVLVYNHLRMIGHAALMHRTEFGRAPRSLQELADTRCAPGLFGEGALAHPDGGTYTLSADGMTGVCSKYGRAEALAPCLEHPVKEVTAEEAAEYRDFLAEYNEYWRTFFDPIAIRVQASAKQYRLETLVLPLIDNSIYTTMAQLWGGKPVALDVLATGRREIGGMWVHVPKKPLLDLLGPETPPKTAEQKKAEPKREGAKSVVAATNDLKQFALAIHNYESAMGCLPAAARNFQQGKPPVSWRVAILPYIEQDQMYKLYNFDEPWDSDHNKQFIKKMPRIFHGPNAKLNAEGKTVYLAPVGKDTMFPDDGRKMTLARIPDGTSNTIMLVEGSDDAAVVWTKPDDLPFDPKNPLKGLQRPGQDSVLVAMGDGSVRRLSLKLDPNTIALAITASDGMPIDLEPGKAGRPVPDRPKQAADQPNDLRQFTLGIHNYHDTFLAMPTQAQDGKGGKSKLSWRVALLPFIEQGQLYNQFKLDEPWDSDHNKKLISRMPRLYQGLDKKLNDEGKTVYLLPAGKDTIFPPEGKINFPASIADGTANTIMVVRAADEAAVVWTKPDDLPFDPKNPLKGLQRPNQEPILVGMADGSVRQFRQTIAAEKLAALFTRAGGEVFEISPDEEARLPQPDRGGFQLLPDLRLTEDDLRRLEDFGLDLNKLRRFLRVGIGDQVGFHMHDASKLLDYDIAGTVVGGGGALGGGRGDFGGASMFGLGVLVQFATGPSSVSIPVKDAKVVDEFLDELDRWYLTKKAELGAEFGRMEDYAEFYRVPFPKPHTVRCVVLKIAGLKLRLYWGRIGDGLYLANRPFILEDIAAAHSAGKGGKASEPANAMLRVRPENWNEVMPGYNLGWAENHRSACHNNLSMITNVNRGWHDRAPAGGTPDAALMERVGRLYGAKPFCPDGGTYALAADGKSCTCSVHGNERDPRQPPAPSPTSATGKLLKSFAGLSATLTFEADGLRAVVTIERKE